MVNEFTIPRSRWHKALSRVTSFIAKLWPVAALAVLCLGIGCCHYGCTAKDKTHEILKRDGYEVIETGNHAWLDCGEGDVFSNTFVVRKDGKEARGAVCCGLFKNCTVRWE